MRTQVVKDLLTDLLQVGDIGLRVTQMTLKDLLKVVLTSLIQS